MSVLLSVIFGLTIISPQLRFYLPHFLISQPAIYFDVRFLVERVFVEDTATLILLLVVVVAEAHLTVLDLLEALLFAL